MPMSKSTKQQLSRSQKRYWAGKSLEEKRAEMKNRGMGTGNPKAETKIKVMEAKIPLEITIKKEDLKAAKPGDKDNCAVAKAIQRHLGTMDVSVGTKIISILKNNTLIRFKTPAKISKALPIFDKTGCWNLDFGTYNLLPPSPAYTLEARRADTEKRRPKKYKAKAKGTGKPFRYTTLRALHSRESSKFASKMRKKVKLRYTP
jgi:hypothetical protein